MSAYQRNTLVGLTMLGALAILAWMIIRFGGALADPFAPKQMHFRLVAARADGVSDGTAVLYKGVAIGRAEHVFLHDINQVYIEASVDAVPPLPGNVQATIRPNGLIGGGASILLETAKPQGTLEDGAVIQATYSGLDLFPTQYADLASELKATAAQFRESHVVDDVDATVNRVGKLSDSLNQIAGDAQTQSDLKVSIANIRQSTEEIKKFSTRLDKLSTDATETMAQAHETLGNVNTQITTISKQVSDRMQQIATLLQNANEISAKVNKGQGSAGQLVNDPKLYASLVDSAQEMDATVKDLKRLVEQWEQEGVSLKLK
ncbi:MAG: MCE family protein [Phycisphaerae bacterium]|nr:MCE family protein [Phycisphaerae bacterium]